MATKTTFGEIKEAITLKPEVTIESDWQFLDEGFMLFSDLNDQESNQNDGSLRGAYTDPVNGPDGSGSPWSKTSDLQIRLDFEDDNTCLLDAPDNAISKDDSVSGDNVMPSSGANAPARAHHGVFNPGVESDTVGPPQRGEAILVIRSNYAQKIKFAFSGSGERRDPGNANDWTADLYEEMKLYVEEVDSVPAAPSAIEGDGEASGETQVAWARAPGGSEDTGDPRDCRAGVGPIVSHQESVGDGSFPNEANLEKDKLYKIRVFCTTRDAFYHVGSHYQFDVSFEDLP